MIWLRRAALAAIVSSFILLPGCGSTYRPIASSIPGTGGSPQGPDAVAVLNQNPSTAGNCPSTQVPCPPSFTLINVSGDTNSGNINVGANIPSTTPPPAPTLGITFAGGNAFVATADTSSDTVTVSSPSASLVTTATLPTGSAPSFVAATATTGLVLVNIMPNSTTCVPTGSATGTGAIGIVQASTGALINTVCLAGSNPGFILVLPGDRLAVVLDQTANTATFVDIGLTAAHAPLAVGTTPVWAAGSADGNTVYVLNKGSHDITVLDAVAQVVTTASISTVGTSPNFILADSAFNRLYVSNSNSGSGSVSVFDASTPSSPTPLTIMPIPVGTAPVALAVTPDGSKVYVANTGSPFASIIDGNSLSVVSTVTPIASDSNARVTWVTVSKDGTKAYVTAIGTGDLTNTTEIVRTSSNASIVNIAPPQQDPTCVATPCALQRPIQVVPSLQ